MRNQTPCSETATQQKCNVPTGRGTEPEHISCRGGAETPRIKGIHDNAEADMAWLVVQRWLETVAEELSQQNILLVGVNEHPRVILCHCEAHIGRAIALFFSRPHLLSSCWCLGPLGLWDNWPRLHPECQSPCVLALVLGSLCAHVHGMAYLSAAAIQSLQASNGRACRMLGGRSLPVSAHASSLVLLREQGSQCRL